MTEGEIAETRRTNPERICVQITDVTEPKPFRFSISGMMVFVTILALLMLFAPTICRWCWPALQPPPPSEPLVFPTPIHDLKDRMMAKFRDLEAAAQVQCRKGKTSLSED